MSVSDDFIKKYTGKVSAVAGKGASDRYIEKWKDDSNVIAAVKRSIGERTATQGQAETPAPVDDSALKELVPGGTFLGGMGKQSDFDEGKLLLHTLQKGVTGIAKAGSSMGAFIEDAADDWIDFITGRPEIRETDIYKTLTPKIFTKLDKGVDSDIAAVDNAAAENIKAGGKGAQLFYDLGASTVEAVPQAVLAVATAGGSAAAQGLEVAATNPGVLGTIQSAVSKMVKNPMYWTSFFSTVGKDYQNALADGATRDEARLYAMAAGAVNATIEIGGGIETLPGELRGGKSALRAWAKSAADEGLEEVKQGIVSRLMENVVYNKGNAIAGVGNGAVLDPVTAAKEFGGGAVVGGLLSGGQVLTNLSAPKLTDAYGRTWDEVQAGAKKEEGKYDAVIPQNVEKPSVPIISMSREQLRREDGSLPEAGNTYRKDTIERTRRRLGLDKNEAVYIPASNVVREGEEYILKITNTSLKKMLSPTDEGMIPIESILVMDNIERIANNGVYKSSDGDRKKRTQIKGIDHLETTVYIDNEPYVVDMRVRLVQEKPGEAADNVLYYFTPEEILSVKKVGTESPTDKRRALIYLGETVPTFYNDIIPQEANAVKTADKSGTDENVVPKIVKKDLTPSEGSLVGPVPTAASATPSLSEGMHPLAVDATITQPSDFVKLAGETAIDGSGVSEMTDNAAEEEENRKELRRADMPAEAEYTVRRVMRQTETNVARAVEAVESSMLQAPVQQMADEYIENGSVSRETREKLFAQVWEESGHDAEAFLQAHEAARGLLRHNVPTAINALRKGGETAQKARAWLDSMYTHLASIDGDLFPPHQQDSDKQIATMNQVIRLLQKMETRAQSEEDGSAEDYRKWAYNDFNAAVDSMASQLYNARRYTQDTIRRKAEITNEDSEVEQAYRQIKDLRRKRKKAVRENLLTQQDNALVGRLLRGEITESTLLPERDNVRGIMAVYKASEEYEQVTGVIRRYEHRISEKRLETADALLKNANEFRDKAKGISYMRETQERNIRDIAPDNETADALIDQYFTPVHMAEAMSIRMKNELRGRIRKLKLSRDVTNGNTVSEAYAVQLVGEAESAMEELKDYSPRVKHEGRNYEEWKALLDDMWKKSPNLNQEKIHQAVQEFRNIYDELFTRMNEVRIRNGYEPVSYRKGYFPHFQQEKTDGLLAAFGKAFGIETDITPLPTTINGRTDTFKPGIRWMGAAMERTGFDTAYDAMEGFDRYLEPAADVIWHTDNIQNLRALAQQIRYRTSDEGIRKQVDEVKARTDLTEQQKQDELGRIYEKGRFTLSNYVNNLEEYTNLLAGKRSKLDRGVESMAGRKFYNFAKTLESRVADNMVGVNPGSWLTNFIPIAQTWGSVSSKNILKAMGRTLGATVGGKYSDGFAATSDFLTSRRGSERLAKTKVQQISEAAGKGMEAIDQFTSEVVVRARYMQNIERHMSEEAAMADANSFAASLMAARSKGAMPTIFASQNPLIKLVTQFQLEVNNQLSYLFKDLPRDMRDKAKGRLLVALLKFFIGSWLYNEAYEKLVGRRPALDPINMINETVGDITGFEVRNAIDTAADIIGGNGLQLTKETKQENAYGVAKNVVTGGLEELPFVGGLLGGGRLPISSAIPDFDNVLKAIGNDDWDKKKRVDAGIKEAGKLAAYLLPPVGGGQIKKLTEGTIALARGGSYTVNADGEDILQYPVEPTAGNAAKTLIFGKSATQGAQDWVESGFKSLSAKATEAYNELIASGVSADVAFRAVKKGIKNDKKEDTLKDIDDLPLSREEKNMLYRSNGYAESKIYDAPWNVLIPGKYS